MLRLGRSEPLQLPLTLPTLKKRAKGLTQRPRMEKLPAKVTHDRGSEWGWMSVTGDGDGKGFRERLGEVRLRRGRQAAWEWRRRWREASLHLLSPSILSHSNKPPLYFTGGKRSQKDQAKCPRSHS